MGTERQEKTQAIAAVKDRVQLSKWQRQIEERQASGIGIQAWCEHQGISPSTYYYRLRKVREYLCRIIGQHSESPGVRSKEDQLIVPISMPVSTAREGKIEIRCGELHIFIPAEVSTEALKAMIGVLRSC